MAIRDVEAFVRECAAKFDTSLDISPGSPFDKQVIQPLVRRLGTDPFSVDMETFLLTRLNQAFPELAVSEGDGITDLLVQPAQLLWDAIVREIDRVRKGLSFKDPSTLTKEEAEALGANFFAERPKGEYARGLGRIFFAQAQSVVITPINFFTSKSGLLFPPTETQSIRVEEMLLNTAGDGTYYFDVNVIAEKPGSDYNIGPDDLSAIANLDAAVRVTNIRRFKEGLDEQDAATFVDDVKQQLSERSMVTLRGVSAKITKSFSEVSRLNVVGFGDPEMQRDVLRGGGLGALRAAGTKGRTVADSFLAEGTSRFVVQDLVDFTQVVGPVGSTPQGFVLTVVGAFNGGKVADDLRVARVISATTLEVEEQTMTVGRTNLSWTVRKRELTLSGIPGGILFPDSPAGTITIPDDEVHVGGATDIHIRGAAPDETTLLLDSVSDDEPELSGTSFGFDSDTTKGSLVNYTLGVTYTVGDGTYAILQRAATDLLSLQVMEGPNAGVYRVLKVVQVLGASPVFTLSPAFPTPSASPARWKLFDVVNIDLTDIKETLVTGSDLITAQHSDVVKTVGGTDFDSLGVAKGYVLRILSGDDVGDYTITEAPLVPNFQQLRLDSKLTASLSGVQYTVFRPNTAGNLQPPLIRIKSVDLLDSSNQPLGSKVPYAKPVDIQTRAFQNPARGVKRTFEALSLGLVSRGIGLADTFAIGGTTLKLEAGDTNVGVVSIDVDFSASPLNKTASAVAAAINAAILAVTGEVEVAVVIVSGSAQYVGIRPFGPTGFVQTLPSGTATTAFFGDLSSHTTNDIRSMPTLGIDQWRALTPAIDFSSGLDVFQIQTGTQVGPVPGPYEVGHAIVGEITSTTSAAILPLLRNHPFAPEVGLRGVVGARSLGSARMYFLEPTSIEVRATETLFSVQSENGELRFLPDPTLSHQRIPALPSGSKPHDGALSGDILTAASQDFVNSSIRVGDRVLVDYRPVAGTVVLPDPVPNLAHKTFRFSLDGSAVKELVFIRDDASIASTEVTRSGVAAQINASAGITLVKLRADNHLEFDVELLLSIFGDGTANPLILGEDEGVVPPVAFSGSPPRTNVSPVASADPNGYVVTEVNPGGVDTLRLSNSDGTPMNVLTPITRQQFRVLRTGVQRTSTGTMLNQTAEVGLYYADVELVSEGVGDEYNIAAELQMRVTGEQSDGYYLTTADSNLTFSAVERPQLVLSKSILEQGVDDDPVNSTQLLGQNLQITYERSSLVEDVNSFALSETERVVNASPLVRHLIPHYVRIDVSYVGGSSEEVTVPALEQYINDLPPVDALESSDVQQVFSDAGATSIDNPLDLIALVHSADRTVQATRSQNRLYTGRLAAFIPDRLNVVRRVS
jgi:hypothetical protein